MASGLVHAELTLAPALVHVELILDWFLVPVALTLDWLLVLSGIWAASFWKSTNARQRTSSAIVFHCLLLGFVAIFFYLLCHAGGHALAEISFGRFSLANSDFWGMTNFCDLTPV